MKLGLIGALLLTLAACDPELAEPPAAPVVNQYIQNVTYVYNGVSVAAPPAVTAMPVPQPALPTVVLPPPPPRALTSTGLDECDALFATTTRCVEAETTDDEARARFYASLEPARERAESARASGDVARIAAVDHACAVSLDGYRASPCTP